MCDSAVNKAKRARKITFKTFRYISLIPLGGLHLLLAEETGRNMYRRNSDECINFARKVPRVHIIPKQDLKSYIELISSRKEIIQGTSVINDIIYSENRMCVAKKSKVSSGRRSRKRKMPSS